MWTNDTTICALATSLGGAIGIIRISGSKAIEITSKVFSKDITKAQPYSLHYGNIISDGQVIDEVMISIYRAPHSYTGEDCVEISCHGSEYIISKVLELLIDNGCSMAEPGEFTMRAFMNGKMDMSQAEAVADLIASKNKATHKMAMNQMRGEFSSQLKKLREKLLHLTSLLELELDFSDHEDLEFANRDELHNLAKEIERNITRLANSFKTGQALKKGILVAIVGQTNVGKSTLLNCLLKDDRAIVSDIHGTTRDTIEDTIDINGVCFRFIDTAGLRYTEDEIEQQGIERTYKKIEEATIVVWLTDGRPTEREIKEMEELTYGKETIVVQNKIDLSPTLNQAWTCPMFFISAKKNIGIEELEQAIYKAANIPEISAGDIIVSNPRHYEALKEAKNSIEMVITSLDNDQSTDLIAEDLRTTINHLATITGTAITTPEILSNIFSHFCVGK